MKISGPVEDSRLAALVSVTRNGFQQHKHGDCYDRLIKEK